jgi:hypothetical protein
MEYRGIEILDDEIIIEIDLELVYKCVRLLFCFALIWVLALMLGASHKKASGASNPASWPYKIHRQPVPQETVPALVYHKPIPTYLI